MRTENPKSFITSFAFKVKEHNRWMDRQLTNASVILRKRLRDLNDDDRTGVYSPITGNWTTIDLSGIYSWNIVKPTIRANTSALATANVKIDVRPRFTKDSEAQMSAEVCQSVLEQKEREQWTQQLEEYLANEMQVGPGVFLHVGYNPQKVRKHSLPQWDEVEVTSGGIAVCPQCGTETAFEEVGEAVCQECGSPAVIEQEPQTNKVPVPTGFQEFTTGCSETKAFPFFEFRVDEIATQGGNLKAAKWMERHYLVPLDELELEYPESAEGVRNQAGNWSYPLKWAYTLKTGRSVPIDYPTDMPVEVREVRDIWLTPSLYLNIKLDDDLILKNKDGKVRFGVKKDQTFAECVYEGKTFDEPPVLCFRLVGDELIDVYPSDFREEYFYISFLSNPSAFWGLFANELITLQDIVNYMLTIQMYHIRRNAITSIVYNRGSFDPESFSEDLIPTKQNLPHDVPISAQFGVIPALTLSQEPMQMLQAVMASKGDITQVQPAMVGETQPGQPYAAQLLQKQQSLGLLSQASLSKANAKTEWAKRQLKLAQEYWTDEDTEELLKLNGEWTEDTIQAFLHCDIESDLIIDFATGSEIPTTLMERELKLRQTLTDLMGLAQVDPSFVKPETLNEILTEILQAGGIDLDINDTEADLRLAESRYDKLVEIVRQNDVKDPDPDVNKMFAQAVLQSPFFKPMPIEGHKTIIGFYSDKLRQEAAKNEPDYLLITCLEGMIAMQMQSAVQQGQLEVGMQMAIQAPMMQQQQQMQQEQMAQEQAGAEAQAQREAEAGQMASQEAQADRDMQRESQMLQLMDKDEDRKLKRDEMKSKERIARKVKK